MMSGNGRSIGRRRLQSDVSSNLLQVLGIKPRIQKTHWHPHFNQSRNNDATRETSTVRGRCPYVPFGGGGNARQIGATENHGHGLELLPRVPIDSREPSV